MRDHSFTRRIRIVAMAGTAAAVLALAAGCAQTPKPLEITQETQQSIATVQSVDQATRMVTLRDAAGKTTTFQAGPDVRNLAQVKPGDRVVVSYQEALLAEVVKKGTGTADASAAAVRAEPGQRPGVGVAEQVRIPVKVYAVDPAQNTIEVTGPRGYNTLFKVKDPKAQAFIRGLKVGDEIEVTYREAMAIAVEPAK
jgi:hypothetical protein